MNRDTFVERYGALYEHSPWVAERAWDGGVSPGAPLAPVLRRVVERAGEGAQLALLRAHPDLAGRIALTDASTEEQKGAGLDQCTPEEFEEFSRLNTDYTARFGFPFIVAVKGLDRAGILKRFRARVENAPATEFRTALDEVHKIAGFRLAALTAPAPVAREHVPAAEVERLATSALARAGADAVNAAAIAHNMALAERCGSESHGLFRLAASCGALQDGWINGSARPRITRQGASLVMVDGDGGAAPGAYDLALPALGEAAKAEGVAVLSLTNTVHFGAMWPEVEVLAREGLAAFAATANVPYLAPHGGTRPFFGTNPLAFAWPTAEGPIAFDFATSAMARGDVMLAARDGRAVAEGVGVDAEGASTTDPEAVLAGAQLPFGAHKGSLIAMMVELLAAGLLDAPFSIETPAERRTRGIVRAGVFVLALSPDAIGGPGARARADAWVARLGAEEGVRLPGVRRRALANTPTVAVEATLLQTVRKLAGETN
ncbi:MAG: 2-oxo-4-hydroxy-4-carboxy-5-ureidoimidazoline decarboxylase [Pseudomonadota bacterium]